jgi:hypothetical protein
VGVKEGTMIVGGMVGYGNGLSEELGLMKIIPTTAIKITVAVISKIDKRSQKDTFIFVPPLKRVYTGLNGSQADLCEKEIGFFLLML